MDIGRIIYGAVLIVVVAFLLKAFAEAGEKLVGGKL